LVVQVKNGTEIRVLVFKRTNTTWVEEYNAAAFGSSNTADNIDGRNRSVNMDSTGTRFVVGFGGSANNGRVSIHIRDDTSWSIEQTITGSDYGMGVAINSDGDTIAIAADTVMLIYDRSGTTWTETQSIGSIDFDDVSGDFVDIDGDGTRILMCNRSNDEFRVYVLSSGTWSLEQTVTVLNARFGAINKDGTRLAVHSSTDDVIYVYARLADTDDWYLDNTLTGYTNTYHFLEFDNEALPRLFVGDTSDDTTQSNAGIADIYTSTLFDHRVVGINQSTDNSVPRYEGTNGNIIQSSGVTISDADQLMAATLQVTSASGPTVTSGTGAPSATAVQGSIYIRTDGSSTSTRMYINTTGSTTWTAFTTAA